MPLDGSLSLDDFDKIHKVLKDSAVSQQAGPAPAAPSITAASTPIPPATNTTPAGPAPQPGKPLPTAAESPGPRPMTPQPVTAQMGSNTTPMQQHQEKLNTLQASPSGIAGIHHAAARIPLQILDAVGQGFLPRFERAIPGTEGHHQQLIRDATQSVNQDEQQANAEATRTHLGAETTELGTRSEQEKAHAFALAHPTEKAPTNDLEVWIKQNPDKPITQFWAQKTEAEKKEPKSDKVSNETELWIKQHPDGKAEDLQKFLLQGKPEHRTPLEDRIVEEYQHGHPGATLSEARKATEPKPPADHGQNIIDPATNTMIRVEPGQHLPSGAMTPNAASSQNVPTAQTRSMAEAAPKVIELSQRVSQLIDQQEKNLGPGSSRLREFFAGKVGAGDPEYTKLRTVTGLLQTALMRMHVGARGGEQIMQHFHDLIDASKQDPENLRAALGEIMSYAQEVAKSGHAASGHESQDGGHQPMKVTLPSGKQITIE